jgi:hypothetical protein
MSSLYTRRFYCAWNVTARIFRHQIEMILFVQYVEQGEGGGKNKNAYSGNAAEK